MADDAAAPQTIVTRALGPVAGAAAKGGVGVAGITDLLNYLWECHDKHALLHPDNATLGVMALSLVTIWDEIRVRIVKFGNRKRRRADSAAPSPGLSSS